MNVQATEIEPDFELVARCRAGDAEAWRSIYDANFAFLERVSRRLGTPDAELDDVVQETFLVAFRKLRAFEEGRFSTWLYRIAANIISARHRRRRIRAVFDGLFGEGEPEVAVAPDHLFESREAQARVGEVLAAMAFKKREVFALYELEGLSGEEIAERLGCKVDTVWSRLHYARKDFERLARKRGLG